MSANPNDLQIETETVVANNDLTPGEVETTQVQTTLPNIEPANDPVESDDPLAPYGRDAEGKPNAPYGLRKDGVTPAKKRGRKGGDDLDDQRQRLESVSRAGPRVPPVKPITSLPPIVADYEGAARIAANAWFGVGTVLLGDDWSPDTANNEHQHIKKAFKDYFEEAQIGKINPAIALGLTLFSYTAVRLTKPTVKTRLQRMVSWLKSLKR